VYDLLHGLSAAQRDAAMEQLRAWAGVSPAARASHRTLTVDELVALGASGIVDIGSHTLTHLYLAGAPATVQRWEVQRSRAVLEEMLGRPVRAFAYPFGAGSAETAALVREAGYRYACASHPDVVWNQADLFRLPRVVVRDSDGDSFARTLRYWLPV
jgi:peptidoglycan/xylan/chitin deacetylase (PgdA/CDA1 family)